MNAIVPGGHNSGGALIPTNMEGAMRLAEMMAHGKLVPQHLRDSPGDCLMVIEQAMRWGMSPFAVAQCTGLVKGKLSYEGKLVAAAVHTSGILVGRLDYIFDGAGEGRQVTARGTLRGESSPREVVVTLAAARTDNEHWRKSPDQMLTYHAARVWARRHAPEVMLGVYSPEEFEPNERPADTFTGTTINATAEATDRSQATARAIGDDLPEHTKGTAPPAPKRKTWAELLDDIERDFVAAQTRDAVDVVLASGPVQKALDKATNGARERLDAIVKTALDRTTAPAPVIENDPLNEPVDGPIDSIVAEDLINEYRAAKTVAECAKIEAGASWKQNYSFLDHPDKLAVDRATAAHKSGVGRG